MRRIAAALALAILATTGALPLTAQTQEQSQSQPPAPPVPPGFSAIAVQTLPDGSEQLGRIMKAAGNMRIELQGPNGQSSVQIMRGGEGVAFLIDLQSRSYAVINDPSVASAVSGASDPCPARARLQATGMTCTRVGKGEVSGITTQTWQIKAPQLEDVMWIEWDAGRKRALSQRWPDGTTMTMTFQAMQEMEGRQVEYWSTSLQAPGQPAAIGGWWFDPVLLVVVREKNPDGLTRELREIRVGDIDPALFFPPQGFTQVEARAETAPGGQ